MIVLSFIINGVNCLQKPKLASEALQTALYEAVIAAKAMHLPKPMEVDEWIEEAANVEKSDAIPNIACEVCLNLFLLLSIQTVDRALQNLSESSYLLVQFSF